ncbi:hypothetical protein [Roseibium sp.]|uniref:hypothetical protein n=1 Tax=Roseibium sp. TaxID=1936156 RepID=UPI00327CE128
MSKLIAEAITEYLGERCADFDADCLSCKTWAEYDALSQARAEGRREGLEEAAKAVEGVGNFGDYRRDELTKDYGQPRFDMMHDIIAAIRALAQKEGKDGPHR